MFGRRKQLPAIVVFLGPFFVLGAAVLIFWNEHHTLRLANSLTEGIANVVEAKPSSVDPNLEGKLIHLTGEATSDETLQDPQFGVQTRGLRLTRVVEICESTQEKRSLEPSSGTRNPDGLRANWRNLSTFGSPAPGQPNGTPAAAVAYPPMVSTAAVVRVGAYGLGRGLFSELSDAVPLALTAESVRLPSGTRLLPGGQIYVGLDPTAPRVGDLRITEQVTPLGPVSVVAAQRGDRLVPCPTRAGAEVGLVRRGALDAPEMLTSAQTANHVLAWVLRGLGFIGLVLGIRCLIAPLSRMVSFVPILRTVVAEGAMLVSFLGSLIVWSWLVSLAWMVARPLVGLGMLTAVSVGGLLILLTLNKRAVRRRVGSGLAPPPAVL